MQNYSLLRITISYLKPYNCEQTNDYHKIETTTWMYITVCKLFVFDRNTLYHIMYSKTLKKQQHKKYEYKRIMNAIPKLLGLK